MSGRVIRQIVPYDDLFLIGIDADYEVSLRVVYQRLALTSWSNTGVSLSSGYSRSCRLVGFEGSRVASRETLEALRESLKILFAAPIEAFKLFAAVLQLVR